MPKQQATEATICRTLKAAAKAGHTVYGYTVSGGNVTVHTQPMAPSAVPGRTAAEDWFSDDKD